MFKLHTDREAQAGPLRIKIYDDSFSRGIAPIAIIRI